MQVILPLVFMSIIRAASTHERFGIYFSKIGAIEANSAQAAIKWLDRDQVGSENIARVCMASLDGLERAAKFKRVVQVGCKRYPKSNRVRGLPRMTLIFVRVLRYDPMNFH